MTRRLMFAIAAVVLCLSAAALWPRLARYERHHDHILGTSLDLAIVADSAAAADRAEAAALAEIARLDRILSGYSPESEFSRWARTLGEPHRVSPELFDVLALFDEWRARTAGALDPAAEAVVRVWQTAAQRQQVPTPADVASAIADVRQTHWTLDPAARTATRRSATPLRLNSFVKSYIVERAAAAAQAVRGVRGVMVNIGGDLVVRGAVDETVALTDPRAPADNASPMDRVTVRDRAVATSGGYRRGVEIAGQRHSHIVDPRTGQPAGHVLSATVVSRQATNAGALATAFCVLAPEESAALAATVPGVDYLLVLADGRRIASEGWPALSDGTATWGLPDPIEPVHAAAPATWDPAFALTVSLELAQPGAGARRPYVAVWVEDKDRFPVRTLAVWYERDHPKWLPDLRAWYRGDRLRGMAEGTTLVGSISSATRPPGRYTLAWDGKDNQGRPVKAGEYTIYIEAAREHGTYQIMKQAMTFPGAARKVVIPGNPEVTAASIDYHLVASR